MISERDALAVITPSLNAGWRLRRCVDSILPQLRSGDEYLICDGLSTDGSLEAVQNLPGVRLDERSDSGPTEALDRGIRATTAPLITWLNADDELMPGALHQLRDLAQMEHADVVAGNVIISQGNRQWVRRPRPVTEKTLAKGNPLAQPGTLIRRAALEKVGGLYQDLSLAFDYDLWVRLFLSGARFAHLDETVARFEIHPESLSGRTSPSQFWDEHAHVLRREGLEAAAAAAEDRAKWHGVWNRVKHYVEEGDTAKARRVTNEYRLRPGVLRSYLEWASLLAIRVHPGYGLRFIDLARKSGPHRRLMRR